MRKRLLLILLSICSLFCQPANALLSLELTRGIAGAVPIAIAPFAGPSGENVAGVITSDLQTSGRFKVYGKEAITNNPSSLANVQFSYFRSLGADNLVIGHIDAVGGDRYQVSFQLIDVTRGTDKNAQQALAMQDKFTVPASQLRAVSHHISDLVYQHILGTRGVFSTRLAYVVVQHGASANATRHILEVADADGYNPRQLLTSPDPIMSPAWSPNGKQIAYVSFENRRASIYIQDVQTGARRLVSQFKGINGAPAWSHDARKLAVVLSKDGSPNIYMLDVATGQVAQLTHDFAINTEPAWSPDGRTLLFTSNRGGGPQIYQINLATRAITRVSYAGDYNARASFTADGSHIAMLHRDGGIFSVGMLDLDTGSFHLLGTGGTDSESPSIAPNGSVVLYGTLYNGRSILGMVSSDGKVQIRLPARNGDVQDPAWSPFLS